MTVVNITDFENDVRLTVTGSPTFGDDGFGGRHVISDGAGGRVNLASGVTYVAGLTTFTSVVVVKIPNATAAGEICYVDGGSGANRLVQMYIQADGSINYHPFNSAGNPISITSKVGFDDDTLLFLCHITNPTDGEREVYFARFGVDTEVALATPYSFDINGFDKLNSGAAPHYFCASDSGSFPLPNGATVAQYKFDQDNYWSQSQVQAEYDRLLILGGYISAPDPAPAPANVTWLFNPFTGKLDQVSVQDSRFRWAGLGPFTVGTDVDGAWISNSAFTITSVRLWRGTAGSSGSTIVDIHKNGTTMYTTQGNRPTILFSDADNIVDATLPDVVAVAQGDVITLDIDQIEAGTPLDLVVMVEGS